MKTGVVIAGVLVAGVIAAGGWLSVAMMGEGDGAQERVFASPERRTIAASVLATGILRLRVGGEVRVGAQLSGIVEKLNVEVGSKVEKGDVIAKIDSRGLEARLGQARAEVEVARQEVRRAEVELARAKELDEKKLIAASQVEDAQLSLDDAKAKLERARQNVNVVETELSYAVIRSPITGTVASVSTQEGRRWLPHSRHPRLQPSSRTGRWS